MQIILGTLNLDVKFNTIIFYENNSLIVDGYMAGRGNSYKKSIK